MTHGVAELREVLTLVRAMGVPESDYRLNFSIARGLDYYTGTCLLYTSDAADEEDSVDFVGLRNIKKKKKKLFFFFFKQKTAYEM